MGVNDDPSVGYSVTGSVQGAMDSGDLSRERFPGLSPCSVTELARVRCYSLKHLGPGRSLEIFNLKSIIMYKFLFFPLSLTFIVCVCALTFNAEPYTLRLSTLSTTEIIAPPL